ncbi:WD40-repeat-containing domain protein [Paraphysoderma sedebokerense]|nr:WD40-repeat-containing domain protein [Paraphysoderma sedebokerense]
MESVKLLQDLESIAAKLKTPFLTHFFRHFSPSTSKHYASSLASFHLLDYETADYRSAYSQATDWFYGWNVSVEDPTEHAFELPAPAPVASKTPEDFAIHRLARKIDMRNPLEVQECKRIIETFSALHAISQRALRKTHFEIGEKLGLVGQNIAKLRAIENVEDSKREELMVWGKNAAKSVENKAKSLVDSLSEASAVTANTKTDASQQGKGNVNDNAVSSRSNSASGKKRSSVTGEMVKKEQLKTPTPNGSSVNPNANDKSPKRDIEDSKNSNSTTTALIQENAANSLSTPAGGDTTSQVNASGGLSTNPLPDHHFAYPTNHSSVPNNPSQSDPDTTPVNIVKDDIDIVYSEIDQSLDYTLVSLCNSILVLALTEVIGDSTLYSKRALNVHETSNEFISNVLVALWDLVCREITDESFSFTQIRSPAGMRKLFQQILQTRNYKLGHKSYNKILKLHHKFALLHDLFAGIDIFLFPKFIDAHRDGTKSIRPTTFEQNIWLTGGYDGAVRIFDIQSGTCLAQYCGHKSIITDAHFTKNESYIISSSFDRSIKIWNSQNATCERTLQGHTDSITSCDVSPDGRYIVSGSLDQTIRLWDFVTGDCICSINKHSKYVKFVKFSLDGRYVASAGLDRKVYIWDVKVMVHSKNITHVRCIEAHDDYILSIDLHRPSLLLTTSRDQTIKLWDYLTGQCLHQINVGPSWACTVCFSHDGEIFASGSFDNTVLVFKTKTGEKLRQIRVFNLGIMSVRIAKNNKFLVCGTREGLVQIVPL